MRKFISRFIKFNFLLLGTFLTFGTSVKFYEYRRLINYNIENKNKLNNTIGVFGHSHPQTAINPKLFNKLNPQEPSLYNYSLGGQSMLWSVMNARQAYNLGCRNFIFEVTNNTFTTSWKSTDYERSKTEIHKILLFKTTELIYILKDLNTYRLLKPFLTKLIKPKQYLNGHYSGLDAVFNDSISSNEDGFKINRELEYHKEFNTDLLLEFIKEHQDCKFMLFRAPLNPKYTITVESENLLNEFKKQIRDLSIDFIDCKNWISQNNFYSDLEHLNKYGADTFTRKFSPIISQTF